MPPKSKSGQEDRTAAILQAAFDIFSSEGYAATRMEDIAARAGITKGLIYFYYKNKQKLFEAMLEERLLKPTHAALLSVPPASSVASHLVHVLDELYERIIETPLFDKIARLILMEGHRFPQFHEYYYSTIIEPTLELVRKLLQEGARRKEWTENRIPQFPQILLTPGFFLGLWNANFSQYAPIEGKAYAREHQMLLLRALGLSDAKIQAALTPGTPRTQSVDAAPQKNSRHIRYRTLPRRRN